MPTTFKTDLKNLFFDPQNPRLIGDFNNNQEKIFRYLIDDIGVDDLLESFAASGIFNADPIIVREKEDGKTFYVIEGNRRLAVLKLLTGERPQDGQAIPKLPAIDPNLVETFKKDIEVQIGWSAELLQSYLGYKHVTAAREWSPEAKAKFVFEHAKEDFSPDNLRKFAKSLGTQYPTLRRWLIAYLALREAEKEGIFDRTVAPSKGYFGTFYTLLGGQQAQSFLQLQTDPLTESPVPHAQNKALSEFIEWTIGTKDHPAVVNSRQQKQFEQILASPKALQHFRVRKDVEASLLYTEYNAEEIASKFREAAYAIEDCLTKLFDVRDDANVIDAFGELEKAYQKAKLNIQPAQAPKKG